MADLFGHPEKNGWREAFLEFKSFYPRRQAWGQAERTYRQLFHRNELPDNSILRQAVSWQIRSGCLVKRFCADGGDARPLPSSWLRARRWEDDPVPSAKDEQVALEMLRRRPIGDFNSQECAYLLAHTDLNPIIEQQLQERKASLDAESRRETSCRSSGPKQ